MRKWSLTKSHTVQNILPIAHVYFRAHPTVGIKVQMVTLYRRK